MLRPFEMHQPESVEAASALVGRYGDEAALYAGGTELLLVMKEGLVRYRHLVDLKTIPGLGALDYDAASRVLRIGGTVTHRALERHPAVRERFPIIAEVERQVANVRVRNVGTIGGNLCFADPHADPGTLFLTFDAEVELAGPRGVRTVPMGAFFTGAYETARQLDEVLTAVRLREGGPHTRWAYMKFGIHERPTLGVAVALTLDADRRGVEDVRIAVGCVGPTPARVPAAEEILRGTPLAEVDDRLERAAAAAAAA
ncbi:MAG: FAD binding domain-containing protein, partial [Candidatus Rokubacteria bacterium]|nr:FAD binding domain-containing protein [Candidatus Rokubacteria bacterium]